MKLRILSDLHLEFHPFKVPVLPEDHESILILAGDIGTVRQQETLLTFLEEAASRFRAVLYVLGNHEFYSNAWPRALDDLRRWNLPSNLYVLERDTIVIDDVGFAGATLWADYDRSNPLSIWEAKSWINDHVAIGFAYKHKEPSIRRVMPEDLLEDHAVTKEWIVKVLPELRAKCRKVVLITHHGISHQSVGAKHKTSKLNGSFVSDLEYLLDIAPPDVAIHGHVHDSSDYRLENAIGTRVVVNPRGYAKNDLTQENKAFDPCLTIEI